MLFLRMDANTLQYQVIDDQRDEQSEQVDPIATTQK